MPAVADMQNTIVAAFEDNPDVVMVVYDEGGRNGETAEWFRSFWEHVYLRGSAVFDSDGQVSQLFQSFVLDAVLLLSTRQGSTAAGWWSDHRFRCRPRSRSRKTLRPGCPTRRPQTP